MARRSTKQRRAAQKRNRLLETPQKRAALAAIELTTGRAIHHYAFNSYATIERVRIKYGLSRSVFAQMGYYGY